MRVLVVNGFVSEAVGDAALLSVLIKQLDEAFPGCEVRISSLEDPCTRPYFEHRRNLGSSRRYSADEEISRPMRAMRKAYVSWVGRFWFKGTPKSHRYRRLVRLLPREVRTEVEAVHDADLIVSVGGGYLYGSDDLSGDLTIHCTLAPINLAGRLGKPLVCAPQSFGPFGNDRQRREVRNALNRADLVLTREATSLRLLEGSGVDPAIVRRSVDSAFAFPAQPFLDWRQRLSVGDHEILVGMTARTWLEGGQQAHFERVLAQLIDHIQQEPGRRVVLIPQVTSVLVGEDDRIVNRRIARYCEGRTPILVEHGFTHAEIKGLYAETDLVVGMRFHSVIFALTSEVPAIAIEYHHKATGILTDLGLQEWVVKLDNLTLEGLIEMFDRLVRERSTYVTHLQRVLPEYVTAAKEVPDLIRQAYEDHIALALPV